MRVSGVRGTHQLITCMAFRSKEWWLVDELRAGGVGGDGAWGGRGLQGAGVVCLMVHVRVVEGRGEMRLFEEGTRAGVPVPCGLSLRPGVGVQDAAWICLEQQKAVQGRGAPLDQPGLMRLVGRPYAFVCR